MLKIGVFGVGHLGKFHLNNWKEIQGVEIVGFFDPNDDTAKEVSDKYQLPRFLDADALMDACDAVDVVAPTNYHFDCCEKAIKKGKHVFVEKPLANTMEEARQLVKLAKESDRMVELGERKEWRANRITVEHRHPPRARHVHNRRRTADGDFL